jgi:hypothetical protein
VKPITKNANTCKAPIDVHVVISGYAYVITFYKQKFFIKPNVLMTAKNEREKIYFSMSFVIIQIMRNY